METKEKTHEEHKLKREYSRLQLTIMGIAYITCGLVIIVLAVLFYSIGNSKEQDEEKNYIYVCDINGDKVYGYNISESNLNEFGYYDKVKKVYNEDIEFDKCTIIDGDSNFSIVVEPNTSTLDVLASDIELITINYTDYIITNTDNTYYKTNGTVKEINENIRYKLYYPTDGCINSDTELKVYSECRLEEIN